MRYRQQRLEVAIGAKDFKKWKDIFDTLRLASVTTEVWAEAAKTGSLLAKKGITVPVVDLVIATVALKNGLTVLHRDKHFTMIAKALDLAELGFCWPTARRAWTLSPGTCTASPPAHRPRRVAC